MNVSILMLVADLIKSDSVLRLFAVNPFAPVPGRCSKALARVRATLLCPRRLGLPGQPSQHPCCCHSACVTPSLITFISAALCMQHTLFSVSNTYTNTPSMACASSLPPKSRHHRDRKSWDKMLLVV